MVNSVESEVPASKVQMDDLPDLVIATILSFLPFKELTQVAPHVCRKWMNALNDPIVWLNKKYIVRCFYFEANVLTTLRRVPRLRSLELNRPVSDEILNALCDNCKNLEHLILSDGQPISDSLLNKFVMNCRYIKSLSIPDDLLVDESNAQVLAQLPRLQFLRLSDRLTHDSPIHLGPLADGCPALTQLVMRTIEHLRTEDLKRFLEGKCRTLTHLTLPWIDTDNRCIVPLLKDCTALVSLQLHDYYNRIGKILDACTTLRYMSNLHSLSLVFIGDDDDDEDPADAVALKCNHLLHLQKLEISHLYLQNSILVTICEGCPNINELQLNYCAGLNGNLKELCRLQKLETLALYYCQGLQEKTLVHIARLPNLRKLRLEGSDFRQFKDGISSLLHIKNLEVLSFAESQHTRHFQFNHIPEMLPNLRDLTVRDCEVNPTTMEQLKQQMPRLQLTLTDSRYDFDRIVIKLKMIGVITLVLVYYCLIL